MYARNFKSVSERLPKAVKSCPVHGRRSVHHLRDVAQGTLVNKPRLAPRTVAVKAHPASPQHTWTSAPRTLLLVKKQNDPRTFQAMAGMLSHLKEQYPHLRLIVEADTATEFGEGYPELIVATKDDTHLLEAETDLVVTIGGDGTMLHVSSLFDSGAVPPVLSFSLGTLGFLLPFSIEDMEQVLAHTLRSSDGIELLERMRLACEIFSENGEAVSRCPGNGWQVMNEVALHRGRHPHLTVVDAFFNGQHLTEAVADGLLLSTPTGSTAYSLSAGGPIAHPQLDCFLLTPIAPRSLSFRTLMLPGSGQVELKISDSSRAPSDLSMDGHEVCSLRAGESVIVKASPFPIPCVMRGGLHLGGVVEDSWVRDINTLLQFNTGFRNKSLVGHGML